MWKNSRQFKIGFNGIGATDVENKRTAFICAICRLTASLRCTFKEGVVVKSNLRTVPWVLRASNSICCAGLYVKKCLRLFRSFTGICSVKKLAAK